MVTVAEMQETLKVISGTHTHAQSDECQHKLMSLRKLCEDTVSHHEINSKFRANRY